MQGGIKAIFSNGGVLKNAVLQHVRVVPPAMRALMFSRHESTSAARIEEHGFESTKISDVLTAKGKGADGSWLWCTTDDSVYDAVKSMTQHNVGALVVVKPGEQNSIAGIITERGASLRTNEFRLQSCTFRLKYNFEIVSKTSIFVISKRHDVVDRLVVSRNLRLGLIGVAVWSYRLDYLRKIIVQGRSSKSTKVGDIMTEENKLITVTPDTKVLKAMQLMTDNRIRHIPVVDNGGMMGMVSIGDVVRAVVREHREELNRLNAYIQGGY
ncbi:hypothetical protein SASPL_138187 [Salvia splendens]|uniref:CBS domain-containing protein n=1 Tax=Salvia splendens TaxID=180675 RepID=A0A8X8WW72_SALSN|nr:hypothetical protein SASPL_138187 [Salvia splendens]